MSNTKKDFILELIKDYKVNSNKHTKLNIIDSANKTSLLLREKEKIDKYFTLSKNKPRKYSFCYSKDISNYYNIFFEILFSNFNSFYYSIRCSVVDNKYNLGSFKEMNKYVLKKYPNENISCSKMYEKQKSSKYSSYNLPYTDVFSLDKAEQKFLNDPLNFIYIQNLIINSHFLSFDSYYKDLVYNTPYQKLRRSLLTKIRRKNRLSTVNVFVDNISVNIHKLIKNNKLKEGKHYNPLNLLLKYNEDQSSFKNKITSPINQKLNYKNKDIFILKRKNFFDNTFYNQKAINRREVISDSAISEKEIYHYLSSLLINGKTELFLEFFEKNRNRIDINKQGRDGSTLLINAVKDGNITIVRHLCERDAEVNIRDNKGNTALHYAIGMKFFDVADVLNNFGAREDILNAEGCSPWNASILGL